jgi:hypothetical protein
MSGPTLVGEVAISRDARLKVRVGRRGGRDLVDLRLFRQGDGVGRCDRATKSGFAPERESIPALIELLRMAEAQQETAE